MAEREVRARGLLALGGLRLDIVLVAVESAARLERNCGGAVDGCKSSGRDEQSNKDKVYMGSGLGHSSSLRTYVSGLGNSQMVL